MNKMMTIYSETNQFLEKCFHKLESPAPKPAHKKLGGHIFLRYKHQDAAIAIIQKLARYISGLNASFILLNSGYTQELGAIFRTLDEFNEDMNFLALPLADASENTPTHAKYLQDFFQEEFDDPNNPFCSRQKRDRPTRKNIRAIIGRSPLNDLNPHDSQKLSHTLSQTYSGYVHGASGHICEMYGGNPPRYFLSGMRGTIRQKEFHDNYWNYSYRGLVLISLTAKVLGDASVLDECENYILKFEESTSKTGKGDCEKLLAKMKLK